MIGLLSHVNIKDKKFKEDAIDVDFPYDLTQSIECVIEEITSKKFKYKSLSNDTKVLITYERNNKKTKETILIEIMLDNLLIRHFDVVDDKRSLRVLYIIKPSQREFKLL